MTENAEEIKNSEVTENTEEIENSEVTGQQTSENPVTEDVGSPAAYVYYFDIENAEESETFFNPLLIGDRYVAYMEDGKSILQDIFHED